jgi:alkanesulfonate monooxygenase SsuD/methylene tetrahydromethanopterin reductase-like flavin-dependent oxidoreductase (luciferase family)
MKYGFMTLPRSLDETRAVARQADAAGWDWLGIADSPVVFGESYVHQAVALAETTRVHVGPLVSHVVVRHPVVVGNLLATLAELGGGRTIGTLATGNSAARGLGLRPARLEDLKEAVEAIRGLWAGRGGTYRDSNIPASGLVRKASPILIAADGPRAADLAGEVGDGMLYGGTLDPSVLARRIAAGKRRPEQAFWAAPAISLAASRDEVIDDMGAMLVAQANRALRGAELDERAVPQELQSEVRTLWRAYDYRYHADNARPQNTQLMSDDLAAYLTDNFVMWGDDSVWRSRLDDLRRSGCDGVMFILGQGRQDDVARRLSERLAGIGELDGTAVAAKVGR